MLVAVSTVLKRFLQSTVVPPLPHEEAKEWVRIAELNAESASSFNNRLVLFLYSVEPDPYISRAGKVGNSTQGPPPMSLTLHYLMTFLSSIHVLDQRVMGQVLQAFYTESVIMTRNYLDENEFAQFDQRDEIVEKIRVSLETPELDKVSHLWNAMRTGQRLALYYAVSVASVPVSMRADSSVVSGMHTQKPSVLN